MIVIIKDNYKVRSLMKDKSQIVCLYYLNGGINMACSSWALFSFHEVNIKYNWRSPNRVSNKDLYSWVKATVALILNGT